GQLFPDLEYVFRHALIHEVAYASLLQERRRTIHGQVVAAMEHLYPHRLTEHAEAFGHHALQGERWQAAVTYLRLAADKARGRSGHQQAIAHLEQPSRRWPTGLRRASATRWRSISGLIFASRSTFWATPPGRPRC